MKVKHTALAAALAVGVSAGAQNYIDAIRFNQNTIEGTARSQAMGSAFGALGADLSSAVINPAGMGSYRATEIGLSFGVNYQTAESNCYGYTKEDDKIAVPFNQIGAAFTFGLIRENTKGIISQTLSIGYTRLADYNSRAFYADYYGANSLLDYFCSDAVKYNNYSGNLAYNAYLTDDQYISSTDTIDITYNVWEKVNSDGTLDSSARFETDDDGNDVGLIDKKKYVRQKGYKGETNISYAMNVSNFVYIGLGIGIQSLYYEEKTLHSESYYGTPAERDITSFDYNTELKQNGTGINLKFGVILKPINELRIGLALHTPTFYSINEKYHTYISHNGSGTLYSSPRGEYDYDYRSPGRFVASIAGVAGSIGILSFDYERCNFGNSKFKDQDDDITDEFDDINDELKEVLTSTNTYRVGLEIRALNPVYIRGGYKLTTSPMEDNYVVNDFKQQAISGGLGFRQDNFFIDLAYIYNTSESDYWVLPGSSDTYIYETNSPAKLETTNHNFVITAGFRF